MKGIDISAWQGIPDFNQVKAAGYEFCIIKATEGINSVNSRALQQATAAKAAGLKIGYYHFAHPEITTHTAFMEANHFINTLASLPVADIMPALDVEYALVPNSTAEINPPNLYDWVVQFKSTFNAPLMLYSGYPYLNKHLPIGHDLGRLPLWLSEYTTGAITLPKGWDKYTIWQNSGSAVVPGVSGQCDTNICDSLPLLNV